VFPLSVVVKTLDLTGETQVLLRRRRWLGRRDRDARGLDWRGRRDVVLVGRDGGLLLRRYFLRRRYLESDSLSDGDGGQGLMGRLNLCGGGMMFGVVEGMLLCEGLC
jgi:hypothetical protein